MLRLSDFRSEDDSQGIDWTVKVVRLSMDTWAPNLKEEVQLWDLEVYLIRE